MSVTKKQIRETFRKEVFDRDSHKCRVCGEDQQCLDAHHITDRNLVPNGGYVKENGISLCPSCHLRAEEWHHLGEGLPQYHPDELYKLINSSLELTIQKSEEL